MSTAKARTIRYLLRIPNPVPLMLGFVLICALMSTVPGDFPS